MTLNDFESEIDPVIVERGWEYFSSGAVTDLEEEDAFCWSAFVAGTDDYEVSVFFEEDVIIDWNCDCPYDHRPVCKHVAATLFAIRALEENLKDEKNLSGTNKNISNRQKPTDIQQILNQLTHEEIKGFLEKQLKSNKELRSKLLVSFADRIPGNREDLYRNLINSTFNRLSGQHGFLDYRGASIFANTMLDLIGKAHDFMQNDNLAECLAVVKPVIEEMPDFTNNMDDSSGCCSQIIWEAFALLQAIGNSAPPMMKDELFNYCNKEFEKKKYGHFGWENRFLDILPELISSTEQEGKYLHLLDNRIAAESKGQYSEFYVPELLKAKIAYFDKTGQLERSKDVITDNLHLDKIRSIAIERAVNAQQFDLAKKLCQEKLKQTPREPGRASNFAFLEWLYKIAVMENNTEESRRLAELIFYEKSHDLEHYLNLKRSWPEATWKYKVEEILKWLYTPENVRRVSNTNLLAAIYMEEGMRSNLLDLLLENSHNLGLVDDYASDIQESDGSALLEIYESGIMKLAEKTGRPAYKKVADYLFKIRKIKGGDDAARKIGTKLKVKYPHRPAMKQIIDQSMRI